MCILCILPRMFKSLLTTLVSCLNLGSMHIVVVESTAEVFRKDEERTENRFLRLSQELPQFQLANVHYNVHLKSRSTTQQITLFQL